MRAGVARNTRTEIWAVGWTLGAFTERWSPRTSCELASWRFRWLLRTRLSLVAV